MCVAQAFLRSHNTAASSVAFVCAIAFTHIERAFQLVIKHAQRSAHCLHLWLMQEA